MAKNTKAALLKIRSSLLLLLVFLQIPIAQAYTDQIVIEMPNASKTIYDIRIHSYIRHMFEQGMVIDPMTKEWLGSYFEEERQNYIEQYLAQNYVSDNGLNLKPTTENIQAGVRKIHQLFSSVDARKKAFDAMGLDDQDIVLWVTNRLILQNFMTQSIQDRIAITDQKLQAHYQAWKTTRFFNKSYDEVASRVKEDLSKTLLKEEFEKWVDQEKRRQKMILKVVKVP